LVDLEGGREDLENASELRDEELDGIVVRAF